MMILMGEERGIFAFYSLVDVVELHFKFRISIVYSEIECVC